MTGGAAGVLAGGLSGDTLWLQLLVGAAIGLIAYWLVPTVWAFGIALLAPAKQRNEARDRLVELEGQHGREVADLQAQHQRNRERERAQAEVDRKQLARQAELSKLWILLEMARQRGLDARDHYRANPPSAHVFPGQMNWSITFRAWRQFIADSLDNAGFAELAGRFGEMHVERATVGDAYGATVDQLDPILSTDSELFRELFDGIRPEALRRWP